MTTNPQDDRVYRIVSSKLSQLDDRIAKLNRRSDRLGQDLISYQILKTEVEQVRYPSDHPFAGELTGTIKEWLTIELQGQAPVVGGYLFLCRVEHTEAGNILSRVPDPTNATIPIPLKYRDAKSYCDHCKTMRRRHDTFVLYRLADQSYVQVGRNCLADFIRDPDRLDLALNIFSFLHEFSSLVSKQDDDDFYSGGGSSWHGFDLLFFLAASLSSIRKEGWVSSAKARQEEKSSTADQALWVCSPCRSRDKAVLRHWKLLQPTQKDLEEAKVIQDWVLSLKDKEAAGQPLNDYHHNLVVIAKRGFIEFKHAGLAASAVKGYQHEQDRLARLAALKNQPESSYYGQVDEKFGPIKVTITAIISLPSSHRFVDVSTLIVMVDEQGHIFKWFASGEKSFTRGRQYMLSAKVKNHDLYQGVKQTLIDGRSRPTLDPVTVRVVNTQSVAHDYQLTLRDDNSVLIEFKTKRSKKYKFLAMGEWSLEENTLRLRTTVSEDQQKEQLSHLEEWQNALSSMSE